MKKTLRKGASTALTASAVQLPRFLTVTELAHLLARNRFTIYHQVSEEPEKLPRVSRVNGRILFLDEDVTVWFAQFRGTSAVAPEPATPKRRGRPTKAEQVARRPQGRIPWNSGGAA